LNKERKETADVNKIETWKTQNVHISKQWEQQHHSVATLLMFITHPKYCIFSNLNRTLFTVSED